VIPVINGILYESFQCSLLGLNHNRFLIPLILKPDIMLYVWDLFQKCQLEIRGCAQGNVILSDSSVSHLVRNNYAGFAPLL
jgi:hypothetical protein